MPWFFLEWLFRLEPRLEWSDIDMRMEYIGTKVDQPDERRFHNILQNRLARGRRAWCMISWREKSKQNKRNKIRDGVISRLSQAQLQANTTRGLTPGADLAGNVVPLPARARQQATRASVASNRITKSNVTSTRRSLKRPRDISSSPDPDYVASDDTEDENIRTSTSQTPPSKRMRIATKSQIRENRTDDHAQSAFDADNGLSTNSNPQPTLVSQNELQARNEIPKPSEGKRPFVPDSEPRSTKRQKHEHHVESEVSAVTHEHHWGHENSKSLQTCPVEGPTHRSQHVQQKPSGQKRRIQEEEETGHGRTGEHPEGEIDVSDHPRHEDHEEMVLPQGLLDDSLPQDCPNIKRDLDFACWSAAWKSFIQNHDAKPLLDEMFLDDQDPGEWPGSKVYGVKDLRAFGTPYQRSTWRY